MNRSRCRWVSMQPLLHWLSRSKHSSSHCTAVQLRNWKWIGPLLHRLWSRRGIQVFSFLPNRRVSEITCPCSLILLRNSPRRETNRCLHAPRFPAMDSLWSTLRLWRCPWQHIWHHVPIQALQILHVPAGGDLPDTDKHGQCTELHHHASDISCYVSGATRFKYASWLSPLVNEVRLATDYILRVLRGAVLSLGRGMTSMVVVQRHLWLTLSDVSDRERAVYLGLFGPSLDAILAKFELRKKQNVGSEHHHPQTWC